MIFRDFGGEKIMTMPYTEKKIRKTMEEMDNSKGTTGEVVSERSGLPRYEDQKYVKKCRVFYRMIFVPKVREKLENIGIEKKTLDLFTEFKEGTTLLIKRTKLKELADELDLVQMALRYALPDIYEYLKLQGRFVPEPIDNKWAACKLTSLINEVKDDSPRAELRKVEPVDGKVVLGPIQAALYKLLKKAADPNGMIENTLNVKSKTAIRSNICKDLRRLCCVDILEETKIKTFHGKRISFKLRVFNLKHEVVHGGAAIAHRRKEIAQEAQENKKQNQQT